MRINVKWGIAFLACVFITAAFFVIKDMPISAEEKEAGVEEPADKQLVDVGGDLLAKLPSFIPEGLTKLERNTMICLLQLGHFM